MRAFESGEGGKVGLAECGHACVEPRYANSVDLAWKAYPERESAIAAIVVFCVARSRLFVQLITHEHGAIGPTFCFHLME